MNVLKRFNEVFVDMLRDLIHASPSDMELRFYKTSIKGILLINKNAVRNVFENNLQLYKEAIMARDERFFLANNFEELKKAPDGIFMKIVGKLKGVWVSLAEKDKNIIWLHFQILLLMLEQLRL
jgi:hypothetical protein